MPNINIRQKGTLALAEAEVSVKVPKLQQTEAKASVYSYLKCCNVLKQINFTSNMKPNHCRPTRLENLAQLPPTFFSLHLKFNFPALHVSKTDLQDIKPPLKLILKFQNPPLKFQNPPLNFSNFQKLAFKLSNTVLQITKYEFSCLT